MCRIKFHVNYNTKINYPCAIRNKYIYKYLKPYHHYLQLLPMLRFFQQYHLLALFQKLV
jgi:hypothetical protein